MADAVPAPCPPPLRFYTLRNSTDVSILVNLTETVTIFLDPTKDDNHRAFWASRPPRYSLYREGPFFPFVEGPDGVWDAQKPIVTVHNHSSRDAWFFNGAVCASPGQTITIRHFLSPSREVQYYVVDTRNATSYIRFIQKIPLDNILVISDWMGEHPPE
jgi:hypothetical protein